LQGLHGRKCDGGAGGGGEEGSTGP
jgi:hypothetical protein